MNGQIIYELFKSYPDVVTVEQLMEMLHIGKVLAYRLITTGKIKAVKIGRAYKIAKQHIAEFVISGAKFYGGAQQ